jgi:hypothetical protein
MKKKQRAKAIEKIIRHAYDSLESHLKYTHDGQLIRREDRKFHKECVAQYAEIIFNAVKLY